MKLTTPHDVPVYTISGESTGRPLPDWLARQRKRSLKQDAEYSNRVELLQDFEFEEASNCIRISDDGEWAMSTGTYKPQIHTHSLHNLALSFARHTISENHSFVLLSSDYKKSVHLQRDRRLEFHTPMGRHYETRLPRYGRDLIYDRHSAEALVPAVGVNGEGSGEVYRLNLEIGRFMKPYEIDVGGDDSAGALQGGINTGSVNTVAIAVDSHNLLAFGTSIGTVEFWDPRSKSRVGVLPGQEGDITALDFDRSGLSLATGSSQGIVQLFDLRRPVPILRKDQGYGYAIKNIIHLTTASQEKKILSSDKRIIKIWDEDDGKAWTSVEPAVDLNCVAWCKDSGMLLTANEGKQQHAFFIPQLGPAPKWCSFLDNMVEEMAEEAPTETYDNYKFLTRPELKQFNLDHLIGTTSLLRPYMHGYFVASKLYEEARVIANPYIYDEERNKRIKEKVEKERASRVRGGKKVKVNQNLVDKMLKKQDRREKVDGEMGLLGDNRFGKLFEDEDFAVDERSREFQALNPSTKVGEVAAPKPATNSDSDDDDRDEIVSKPKAKPDMHISSSSYKKSGHQQRDRALGSRVQGAGRVTKPRGEVLGERSVSFAPARKETEKPQAIKKGRRDEGRRSAITFFDFIAHFDFDCFGDSISKDDIFEFPFSTSKRLSLGVGGTSSSLVKPLFDALVGCSASFGNVDRRGVRAVASLLADLRIVFRTSHERFFARYHSTEDAAASVSIIFSGGLKNWVELLPTSTTTTTHMIIAIIPPLDIVMDPESDPVAPASLPALLLPGAEPASPAAGPSPGCCGDAVARALKNEETELAAILDDCAGVKETKEVVAATGEEIEESCAITVVKKQKKKFSIKPRRSSGILNDL